ncbi:hypothetical protein [Halorussus salinus]|uniref:hypothetical protein n=1 Tax=Halorussus salinus TaxID=1364935 RepID=UPI001091F579|nr:hypothetical protein [Halorussus salinus]
MQLTWLALASVLAVGVGYVAVRRARRLAVVDWTLLCGSLFALATRDLFRTRERARPAHGGESATDGASRRSADDQSGKHQSSGRRAPRRRNRGDGDSRRTPVFVRLRRRVAGWLN